MKISLIGAGDTKYHFLGLLGFSKKELDQHVLLIAQSLVDANAEVFVLPDKGICFDVCKKYKELGGKKVFATVPADDKEYGIKHLQPRLEEKVNGKKVIDEVINSGTWYKENMSHTLFANKVLMLGNSLGSMGELVFGYYLYKLFKGHKSDVKVSLKKINSNFFAGENVSFDTLIYSPFIKNNLPFEIEKYIEKYKANINYVDENTIVSFLK